MYMTEDLEAATLKLTNTEAYAKMVMPTITGETLVDQMIESMNTAEITGTVGGHYRKTGKASGEHSETEITFKFVEGGSDDGAFALSMAGALVAAALAF